MRYIRIFIPTFAIFMALNSNTTHASSNKHVTKTSEGNIKVQIKSYRHRAIEQTDFKPVFVDVGGYLNKQIQSCHSCIKVQSMYYQLPWRQYWP